jgi:hypothetical protein
VNLEGKKCFVNLKKLPPYTIDVNALYSGGRVARWYIFKPKIPIRVNFGGPWNGKGWYILCHLEYIIAI